VNRNGVSAPLRPLIRAWLWSTHADQQAIPRPSDGADQRLAGPGPFEVLLVGSGAASGWGVTSHSLGLAGSLARRLRYATERGVTLRTRIDPEVTSESAVDLVASARTRFDDLRVAVLGVNETLTMMRPRDWRRRIDDLLSALDPSSRHPAVLAGIQPISSIPLFSGGLSHHLDRHAQALNDQTAEACADLPYAVFAPLGAPLPVRLVRYRGAAVYDQWAQQLLAPVLPLLPGPSPRASASDPDVEERRQAELRRLGVHELRDRFAIDDIVEFAKAVLGAESAALVVVDEDRVRAVSRAGIDPEGAARRRSFTQHAVDSRDTFVIEDAHRDARFRDNEFVVGPPYARFFAAHPVSGPGGERIGVLCVFGREPREFDEISRDLLRELALRAEAALQHAPI
jgi:hypothetical protein